MAESRLIRRAILDSEKFNSLKVFAQNFYLRLLLVADDYGLCDARPVILRCALYPLSLEKVSESDVESGLTACEEAGLVRLYSVEGKQYLQIANYNQRKQSSPKYPLPPEITVKHGDARCSTVKHGEARCPTVIHGDPPLKTETETETETQQQSHAQARGPAEPSPAATADPFEDWREAMCRAFPALRGNRKLSAQVERAAREACERLPDAAAKAGLLAAYLDDRTPMDRYRNKFYRPMSPLKFFDNLEDVLQHAEGWQKETGWGKEKTKPKPKPKGPNDSPATEAELEAFRAELRAGAAGNPLPIPPPDSPQDVEHALHHLPGCRLPADKVAACAAAYFRQGAAAGFPPDWHRQLQQFAHQFAP